MSRLLTAFSCTRILAIALLGAGVAAMTVASPPPALAEAAKPEKPKTEPQSFASAAEAARALVAAAKAQDKVALLRILGSDGEELLSSGDEVADRRGMEQFAQAAEKVMSLLEEGPSRVVVVVGAQSWPMPIPIVKRGEAWVFDAAAGKDEVLTRRVGENELTTIDVMRAFVGAQKQYAEVDREGDGIKQYARRIKSRPGKRDGLYWETKEGEEMSPLGELVAEAEAEGYQPGYRLSRRGQPYYGYYFKMMRRQGAAAPGGSYSYIVNGRMISGFAMVAYPAQWGNSGVMTFIVSQQGVVFQKNLGPRTAEIAANMVEYNPDASWERVKD
ncbi:MAG TPA: DUF2950 domain-containing protein [Alphaproteobacteria bacterium]